MNTIKTTTGTSTQKSHLSSEICNYLKYAIIGLIFLVPFSDLIIGQSLYFPFITGKGFFARALIIIIAVLYTSLVIRDRSYLPKKTPIVWSAIAFILVLLAATINSIDPWKSFWSNQERMEGFITLAEMFVLFIATTGVFSNYFAKKSKEKNLINSGPSDFGVWKWFLNTALALSVVMGMYALSQQKGADDRIFGTLGNSSYLGGFAMVNFFLAMYLAINLLRRSGALVQKMSTIVKSYDTYLLDVVWVILYAAIGIFNIFIMYQTGTRGSFVGLMIGLSVTAVVWALMERKMPLFKWIGIISIAIVVAVVTFLGVNKNAEFIKNDTQQLNRFAQLITLDYKKVLGDQGHSRMMIWGMSYEGVKERPILGWGQDNFTYVFAKYYDPAMYAQEQWFDRTHNVFFDWLIAAGFLGLLAYLSLFFSAIYMLWRKKDDNWSVSERATIIGMLIAYFVHNFFVFDNLASYIFFFTILAFISTRGQGGKASDSRPLVAKELVLFIDLVAVVFFAYVMWISVISPYNSSGNLIKAMQDKQQVMIDGKAQTISADPKARFKLIKSVVDANDLTRSEGRERLIDVSTSVIQQTAKTDLAFAQEVHAYVKDQYAKEFASSTKTDPRPYFFYSIFQQKLGDFNGALETSKKAVELSPTKQSFLYTEGQILLTLGRKDEAVAIFLKAYELDKENIEALKYYVYSLIQNNKIDSIDKVLDDKAKIDPTFNKNQFLSEPMIMQGFVEVKAFDKALAVAKQKVKDNPTDIQAQISLSAVYLKMGNRYASIEELKKIKLMEPRYASDVDKYIKDIRDGKDPSAQSSQSSQPAGAAESTN